VPFVFVFSKLPARRHLREDPDDALPAQLAKPTIPPLYPWMKLAGRWIEQAGFQAGHRVRIAVEHGRLTIAAE
jgi:hypothetical protein